jgi:hypothetical protein
LRGLAPRQPEVELRQAARQIVDAMDHHRIAASENPGGRLSELYFRLARR